MGNMDTAQAQSEPSMYAISLQMAELSGRMNQVLIDHHAAIQRNADDTAQEKKDRVADVKALSDKLEAHSLHSEAQRATLAANVKDLQADSQEYRTRLDAVGPRAWTAAGVLIALGSAAYTIFGNH